MNSRRKGAYIEAKAKIALQKEGWLVTTSKNNSRFAKEKDYFGLWDAVCVKYGEVMWVQVKTNKFDAQVKRDSMFWSHLYRQHCRIMCWIEKKRKWDVFDYDPLLQESLAPVLNDSVDNF